MFQMESFRPALIVTLLSAFMFSACTHQATVSPAAPQAVRSDYQSKIPGRFALFVNSEKMSQPPRQKEGACGPHSVSLDAREVMKASVLASLKRVIDDVELVAARIDGSQLTRMGYDAIITVEVEDYSLELELSQRFFTADIIAEAELRVGFTAETATGRTTGGSFDEESEHKNGLGMLCSGAETASSKAVEKVMGAAASELSEQISNSDRLRNAVGQGT